MNFIRRIFRRKRFIIPVSDTKLANERLGVNIFSFQQKKTFYKQSIKSANILLNKFNIFIDEMTIMKGGDVNMKGNLSKGGDIQPIELNFKNVSFVDNNKLGISYSSLTTRPFWLENLFQGCVPSYRSIKIDEKYTEQYTTAKKGFELLKQGYT